MPGHILQTLFIVVLLAAGCNDDPAQEPPACVPSSDIKPLIDNTIWLQTEPSDDPLAAHRPEDASCPDDALTLEGTVLEFDTGRCHYASIAQPLPVAIAPCDTVQMVLTHDPLFAVEPATAHAAVLMNDRVVWEQEFPIPFLGSELLTPTFQIPEGVEAGTPVIFHLHNHGVNTWNLLSMAVVPPDQ